MSLGVIAEPNATDDVIRILGEPENREVLSYLKSSEGTKVSLDDLVENFLNSGGSEKINLGLHHKVLPQLSDYGLIEYDQENKIVECESTNEIKYMLERFDEFKKEIQIGIAEILS